MTQTFVGSNPTNHLSHNADVAELADAPGLGSGVLKDVRVRLSPSAFRRSFADVFTQSPIDTSVSLAANGHFIIVL